MKLPKRERPPVGVAAAAAAVLALSVVAVLSTESLRFFAKRSSAVRTRMSFS
jgi:hypothetical protein